MFDFTSSKLLLLGIVALLVIGPKDLPALLRTLGKYMGIVRKHASEFRAQFDEAMRESELQSLKKEVENIGQEAEATIRSTEQSLKSEIDAASAGVNASLDDDPAKKFTADAMGMPEPEPLPVASGGGAAGATAGVASGSASGVASGNTAPLNGAGHHDADAPGSTAEHPRPAEKSGA